MPSEAWAHNVSRALTKNDKFFEKHCRVTAERNMICDHQFARHQAASVPAGRVPVTAYVEVVDIMGFGAQTDRYGYQLHTKAEDAK